MKMIQATIKQVLKTEAHFCVNEITSFEQLNYLSHDTEVLVMHCCELVVGRVMYWEKEMVIIDVVTNTVVVKPDSFKHGNFMYEIVSLY